MNQNDKTDTELWKIVLNEVLTEIAVLLPKYQECIIVI